MSAKEVPGRAPRPPTTGRDRHAAQQRAQPTSQKSAPQGLSLWVGERPPLGTRPTTYLRRKHCRGAVCQAPEYCSRGPPTPLPSGLSIPASCSSWLGAGRPRAGRGTHTVATSTQPSMLDLGADSSQPPWAGRGQAPHLPISLAHGALQTRSVWRDVEPGRSREEQGTAGAHPPLRQGLTPGQVYPHTCVAPTVGSRDATDRCWVMDVRRLESQSVGAAGARSSRCMTAPSYTHGVCVLSSLDTKLPWFLKSRRQWALQPTQPTSKATSVPANRPQDAGHRKCIPRARTRGTARGHRRPKPAEDPPSQRRARRGPTEPDGAGERAGSPQAGFLSSRLVLLPLPRRGPTPGSPQHPPPFQQRRPDPFLGWDQDITPAR